MHTYIRVLRIRRRVIRLRTNCTENTGMRKLKLPIHVLKINFLTNQKSIKIQQGIIIIIRF